jgi:hypothetical protein
MTRHTRDNIAFILITALQSALYLLCIAALVIAIHRQH